MYNKPAKPQLLEHVRRALRANRQPGLHFPGFYLGLHALDLNRDVARAAIPYRAHCANANGDMNICAIALLADMGMGAAMRVHLAGATTRIATATMQLQFTGVPVRSDLICESRFDGFFQGAAATQGRVGGTLMAGKEVIAHCSATFATPPAPAGVTVHPVPWEYMARAHGLPAMADQDMTEEEQRVLSFADSAWKLAGAKHSFIEHLWAQIANAEVEGGATNAVKLGLHVGNRVGHVQGGVVFGIAAATAVTAIPRKSLLTGASAWYISAGMGDRLRVRSRVLQLGKTIAVVRTEVIGENKRPVLEMVTSHAF